MFFPLNRSKIVFFTFFSFLNTIYCNFSFGEGWLQPKNHGIFISSYEMRSFIGTDFTGQYNDEIKFTQGVLNLYGEYGLSNRVTFVGKVIAVDSMFVDEKLFLGDVKQRSLGIDSLNALLRIGIIKNNETVALSFVTGLGSPSLYKKNFASQFAIRRYKQISGLELGINISKNAFVTVSTSYYLNIKHWYNELRFEAMYGHFFLDSILFMVRFQKFIYYVKKDFASADYAEISSSTFDFLANSGFAKINFSLAVPITKRWTFEFGVYSTIKSKLIKTEQLGMHMRGGYVSLWLEF